jgi:dTDP-4-amino-4,6-dideoxygalactose transaminase
VSRKISLAKPIIGRAEKKAVLRVLNSGMLAQGPEVQKFEKNFSQFVDGRECVAVNSGTSALHLSLLALGITVGDEVIVPSFTFAATANSVSLTGAKPVFVDVDNRTFNMDPKVIEAAITPRTKAIQVVHLYGLAANMPEICKIAEKYKLKIIEDAAQAHLATIGTKPVGTFGDAAAFSFYPTKNMTSGEGGMIVLRDKDVARECRLLRNQGMEVRYQNEIVGFNLRMTDIHAAIGVQQLSKLKKWTEKRRENANILNQYIDSDVAPFVPEGYQHSYHQYTITTPKDRDALSTKLTEIGIGNAVYYPTLVHKLPAFNESTHLPNTEKLVDQVLSLPIHPSLSRRDLKFIGDSLARILESSSKK